MREPSPYISHHQGRRHEQVNQAADELDAVGVGGRQRVDDDLSDETAGDF